MAEDFLLKLLLRLALVAVFTIAGYLTARVALPIVSLGKWAVEPLSRPHRSGRAGADRQARRAGIRFVSAEIATMVGTLFWLALFLIPAFWQSYFSN